MIHVADVERSAAFYGLLGFVIGNSVPAEPPMTGLGCMRPKRAIGSVARI